jgi:hypothetical protein
MRLFLLVWQGRCRAFRTRMRRSVPRGMASKTSHSHSFQPSATSAFCHLALSPCLEILWLHSCFSSFCYHFLAKLIPLDISLVKPLTMGQTRIPSVDQQICEALHATFRTVTHCVSRRRRQSELVQQAYRRVCLTSTFLVTASFES